MGVILLLRWCHIFQVKISPSPQIESKSNKSSTNAPSFHVRGMAVSRNERRVGEKLAPHCVHNYDVLIKLSNNRMDTLRYASSFSNTCYLFTRIGQPDLDEVPAKRVDWTVLKQYCKIFLELYFKIGPSQPLFHHIFYPIGTVTCCKSFVSY